MNVIAPSGVGIKIIENVINVIKDKMKGGFDDCWRVSILHCNRNFYRFHCFYYSPEPFLSPERKKIMNLGNTVDNLHAIC